VAEKNAAKKHSGEGTRLKSNGHWGEKREKCKENAWHVVCYLFSKLKILCVIIFHCKRLQGNGMENGYRIQM